jgi:hypothetical protein
VHSWTHCFFSRCSSFSSAGFEAHEASADGRGKGLSVESSGNTAAGDRFRNAFAECSSAFLVWSPPVCKQHKLFFIETSALADSNVGTAFETILKEIYRLISRKTVGADGQSVSPPAEFKGDTIALTAENQNPQPAAAKGKCCG